MFILNKQLEDQIEYMGKPSAVDVSLMEKIIDSMVELGSLRKSVLFHGVELNAFFHTINENPALDNQYMRAQASMAELMAEQIMDIADNDSDPSRARNRIDARKWYASKTKPQKFGDRIDLNINQVVDIGSALAEARSRVVGEIPQVKQLIDTIKQTSNTPTGYEPVDIEHAPKKSSDDIFD